MGANFFEVLAAGPATCALYEVESAKEELPLSEAKLHCDAYRSLHPHMARGFYISRETVEKILAQDTTIDGLRVYGGIKNDGGLIYTACVVATVPGDFTGIHDDYLIPAHDETALATDEIIIGEARPCPIHCGKQNQLNSDDILGAAIRTIAPATEPKRKGKVKPISKKKSKTRYQTKKTG